MFAGLHFHALKCESTHALAAPCGEGSVPDVWKASGCPSQGGTSPVPLAVAHSETRPVSPGFVLIRVKREQLGRRLVGTELAEVLPVDTPGGGTGTKPRGSGLTRKRKAMKTFLSCLESRVILLYFHFKS